MGDSDDGRSQKAAVEIAAGLRRRARRLESYGWLLLSVVVVLLASGVALFFYAADIAKRDVQEVTHFASLDEIDKNIEEIDTERAKLRERRISDALIVAHNDLKRRAEEVAGSWQELFSSFPLFEPVWADDKVEGMEVLFALGANVPSSLQFLTFSELIVEDHPRTAPAESKPDFAEGVIGLQPFFFSSGEMVSWRSFRANNKERIAEIISAWNGIGADLDDLKGAIEAERSNLRLETSRRMTRLDEQAERLEAARNEFLGKLYGIRAIWTGEGVRYVSADSESGGQNESDSLLLTIQTNVTRFGPLLIIMFFVGILIALYKYNIRLAAYYNGRADGLELMALGIDPDQYEKFVQSLSPDRYDFGRMPRSPVDQAVEIAKTIASQAKA